MTELTQEQIKILEDAFNSLPEYIRIGMYKSMKGIQEQLDSGTQIIFYMTRGEDKLDEDGKTYNEYYNMKSMKVKV